MIYLISTIDLQGAVQVFTLVTGRLEIGLELLDEMAARDANLISATVEDGTSFIHLPVEAFDEHRCLPIIEQLEKEWRRILRKPIRAKVQVDKPPKGIFGIRIQCHETCIAKLEQYVQNSQQRIIQVQQSTLKEPARSRTLHQLEATLRNYQSSLATEQTSLQRFLGISKVP